MDYVTVSAFIVVALMCVINAVVLAVLAADYLHIRGEAVLYTSKAHFNRMTRNALWRFAIAMLCWLFLFNLVVQIGKRLC